MEGNLSLRLEENVEKDSQNSRYIKEQNRKLMDQIDRQIGSEKETKNRRERQNSTGKISQ